MKNSSLSWIWRFSENSRTAVFLSSLCGIVRVAIGLSFVYTSKLLVDSAVSASVSSHSIVSLSILLVALLLLEMAFSFASLYLGSKAEVQMKNRQRDRIYNHLLCCRWDKIGHLHSGDLLNRITEDVRVLATTVCTSLPSMIVMLVQFLAAFAMLYLMSWQLAVSVVCIMPFFFIVSKVYVRRTRQLTNEIRRSDSRIQTNMQEGLQHHVVVQSLEFEGEMGSRLGSLQERLYGQTMHRLRFGIFSRTMLRLGFIACYATAFLWSVWHLRTGEMTYGMMTAFLQLVARIQNPMVGMAQLVPGFVHALSSVDRLKELLQLDVEQKGEPLHIAAAGIRLTDVSFRYDSDSPFVFSHFSHDFKPGSKTVVMGPTGVGKSTLVRMLLALLHPQQGTINIYNNVQQAPVAPSTRCNMVYVPQGNSLLEGTVRENLLVGNPEATDEMMRQALHTAVADFVLDLPSGLDTHCGELGSALSEGQAQRIAIARALLRKGNILLLDEFNSSLDTVTAQTLMQRLVESARNNTIIFISHRQDVASFCDNTLQL